MNHNLYRQKRDESTAKQKVYLDHCYFCGMLKATIKYSQSIRDPILCVGMSGYETPEVDWERDRHCFVVTQAQIDADEAAIRDEANFYETVMNEHPQTTEDKGVV